MKRNKWRRVALWVLLFAVLTTCMGAGAPGCALMRAWRNPETRGKMADGAGKMGTALRGAAGVMAGTPLAPFAPWVALLSTIATGVAGAIRPKRIVSLPEQGGGTMDGAVGGVVAKQMSLLDSRKTKLQAIAYIFVGLVVYATVQWGIQKEVAALAIGAIAYVTGRNIDGIATEDAAKHTAVASLKAREIMFKDENK